MEERSVSSPTRVKAIKPETVKGSSKSSKTTDEPQSGIKAHSRAQKSSLASKPPLKLPHTQSQPESTGPPQFRPSLPEGPRRSKSTPVHSSLPPMPKTHQAPPIKHTQLATTHTVPAHSPMATVSTMITTTITTTTTTTTTVVALALSSKSTDQSPNLIHKPVLPQSGVSAARKMPQLMSSVSVPAQVPHLAPARQKMLDRAARARLYFLRQSGPNKFLVGGDSMDSRFHVSIGPQLCSCNKTHCIHLLFVMLRVLKVKQSSSMLWAKQLRNYEVEGLLGEFQMRVNQRRTSMPHKGSHKKLDYPKQQSADFSSENENREKSFPPHEQSEDRPASPVGPGGHIESLIHGTNGTPPNKLTLGETGITSIEEEGNEESEGDGGESDKEEEDVCPICLNELDEGEDLLICPGCSNHLHQHCMDIWAMEEKRKNEQVHCPVCRTRWPYPMSSPSSSFALDKMSTEEEGVPSLARMRSVTGSPGGLVILSQEKMELLDRLKELLGCSGLDGLFSSEWKSRETALSLISREAIPLLLPQITPSGMSPLSNPVESSLGSSKVKEGSVDMHAIQKVCLEVVKYSCNDSVLKIFLASLDLLKVVLGYSFCHSPAMAHRLQDLMRPILIVFLTRCGDAQRRVKDCCTEATCNLCLGQDGALGVGSACGEHQSSHPVTNTRFVIRTALAGQDKSNNCHWWLGRLTFMDRLLSMFSNDFLLSQCVSTPSLVPSSCNSDSDSDDPSIASGLISPSDSITSSAAASVTQESPHTYGLELEMPSMELETSDSKTNESEQSEEMGELSRQSSISSDHKSLIENNLLMQIWYFAARGSHVPNHKVGKLSRRVIIRIAKILRDDPSSLEIVHDVVSRCHRTQAEGLLDRVLQARESPYQSSSLHVSGDADRRAVMKRLVVVPGDGEEKKTRSSPNQSPRQHLLLHGQEKQPSKKRSPLPQAQGHGPQDRREKNVVAPSSSPTPSATSSLKNEADKNVKFSDRASLDQSYVVKPAQSGDNHVRSEDVKSATNSKDQKKLNRQRSRGMSRTQAEGDEEFIPSDESFQSALSELDLDCSSDTITMPMEGNEEEVGVVSDMQEMRLEVAAGADSSSASNSHDSKRSSDSLKQSQSNESVEKGVESGGAVSGFPTKPGFMNFPHMYMRQSTADSTMSSDSMDTGLSFMCKQSIEEEEAEALAKVRSMVNEEVPHPPLSGLIPPTPEVLIHVQANSNELGKSHDETDHGSSRPYIEGVHWVKGKLIGTGAFCTCFLARDMNNGTMFAVKQVSYVRNTKAQEEEELARLRDEISMLGRINHPNIVRCLGATQHDGHINIFIEWMAGGCLDQLLHDFGRFGENVICNYVRQITHGIVFLHEKGIIHRDLKGGNILVDSTGQRLRIADFGAAARLATNNTGSGEFQNMEGTVAFMAPEVVRGGSDEFIGYGRKCDVWSIGCVVIQMATAKPPWAGTYDMKNKFQLIFKIGQASAPPPMPEFINPALKDFTIRCLEVKPEDRPTSIELLKHPLFTIT